MKYFALITVFTLFIIPNSFGEKYQLGNAQVELPLPKSWQSKQSDKLGSLVFFNPQAKSPRPIISVYETTFRYPTEDLSTFKKEFIKEKLSWLAQMEAKEKKATTLDHNDQLKEVMATLEFTFQGNDFIEITRMKECSKEKSIVLKMLFPKSSISQEQKLINELKSTSFCP